MEEGSSNRTTSSLLLFPNPTPTQHEDEEEEEEDDDDGDNKWSSDSVKSVVYAGLDAIVTSFSLISSISAGHLSSVDVLVLGFANLVADAISMGFGDFAASSTEKDMAEKERSAIEDGVAHRIRPQQSELFDAYRALGMDTEDAATVVRVFSKYRDIMVDEKMTTQKGMLPPRQSDQPWKNGLITFAAFMAFGSLPLLSFIVLVPFTDDDSVKFLGACVLASVSLAFLGLAKARISKQGYWKSVAATLFNGCVAAACAYGLGWMLRNVAGLE